MKCKGSNYISLILALLLAVVVGLILALMSWSIFVLGLLLLAEGILDHLLWVPGLLHKVILPDGLLSQALFLKVVFVFIGEVVDVLGVHWLGLPDLFDQLFPVNAGHRIVVVLDVRLWWVIVLAAPLSSYFEAVDLRLVVVDLWRQYHSLLEMLQEVVGEGRSEKDTVNVLDTELWNVDLLAPWAVNFEARDLQIVTKANGEYLLLVTKGSGAGTVGSLEEFLVYFCKSNCGIDVSGVDKPIKVASFLV